MASLEIGFVHRSCSSLFFPQFDSSSAGDDGAEEAERLVLFCFFPCGIQVGNR